MRRRRGHLQLLKAAGRATEPAFGRLAAACILGDGKAAGALPESFVVTELRKQATWAERAVDLAHFQDRSGGEIDVVVEDRRSGEVAGIEVKATLRPLAAHARHLAAARDRLGDRFIPGVLLHTGAAVLPLGDRLWAVPVSDLWA